MAIFYFSLIFTFFMNYAYPPKSKKASPKVCKQVHHNNSAF